MSHSDGGVSPSSEMKPEGCINPKKIRRAGFDKDEYGMSAELFMLRTFIVNEKETVHHFSKVCLNFFLPTDLQPPPITPQYYLDHEAARIQLYVRTRANFRLHSVYEHGVEKKVLQERFVFKRSKHVTTGPF